MTIIFGPNGIKEPVRDVIGRVLYEEPMKNPTDRRNWYNLSEEKREPWKKDADKVLHALANENIVTPEMKAAALELGGVDYLANDPEDVFIIMMKTLAG